MESESGQSDGRNSFAYPSNLTVANTMTASPIPIITRQVHRLSLRALTLAASRDSPPRAPARGVVPIDHALHDGVAAYVGRSGSAPISANRRISSGRSLCRLTRSSCRDMKKPRFGQHLAAEERVQARGRVEVHAAAEHVGELRLHAERAEPGSEPLFKLHQDVDVALGAEIAPKRRAEQRPLHHPMAFAKLHQFALRDVEFDIVHE